MWYREEPKTKKNQNSQKSKLSFEDFEVRRCIGIGGFSTVVEGNFLLES